MTKPRVFIKISGGLVQGTVSDVPCDIEILDYDCDSTEEEALYEIPEEDGEVDAAWVYSEQPLVDAAYCDVIDSAIKEGSVGDRRGAREAEQDAGEVVRDLGAEVQGR